MNINVNGISATSPLSAAAAVSIRSASESCADSPNDSAVNAVSIGVRSPAEESCCATEPSVPTDSASDSVPATEPRRPQARSTPEEFPHHRWTVRRHWWRCPATRAVDVHLRGRRCPRRGGRVDAGVSGCGRRSRGARRRRVSGGGRPGRGPGGAASAGAGRTLRRRRSRGIRAGLRAGDAESLPGRHQHAHAQGDRQCPDAADVIAGTPGEHGRRRHRDEVLRCDAGPSDTWAALDGRVATCGCELYLALPGGSRRRPSHVPHCSRLLVEPLPASHAPNRAQNRGRTAAGISLPG